MWIVIGDQYKCRLQWLSQVNECLSMSSHTVALKVIKLGMSGHGYNDSHPDTLRILQFTQRTYFNW